MRAHVTFAVDGIDLKVAFDCTEAEAYALHQHLVECASKSVVEQRADNNASAPCPACGGKTKAVPYYCPACDEVWDADGMAQRTS